MSWCFIALGNYYSLRGNHEKAVVYFQRALRLNPQCTSAYTLMGHEYMETKNTSAAIEAYRRAIGMVVVKLLIKLLTRLQKHSSAIINLAFKSYYLSNKDCCRVCRVKNLPYKPARAFS